MKETILNAVVFIYSCPPEGYDELKKFRTLLLKKLKIKLSENSYLIKNQVQSNLQGNQITLARKTPQGLDKIVRITEQTDRYSIRTESNKPTDDDVSVVAQALLATNDPAPVIESGTAAQILLLTKLLVNNEVYPQLSQSLQDKLASDDLKQFNELVKPEIGEKNEFNVSASKPRKPSN